MAAGGMVVSFVAVMLLTRERRVPGVARAVPVAVVATALGGGAIFGLFFVALHHTHANVLYLLAIRHGMLTVVAAVAGLYPASTVLLAHTQLGERLRTRLDRPGREPGGPKVTETVLARRARSLSPS